MNAEEEKRKRAFDIGGELGALPRYPRDTNSKLGVGEALDDICQTMEQLEAVYKELRSGKYPSWEGFQMIRRIHADLFPQASPRLPDCSKCQNSGWRRVDPVLPDCPKCKNQGWVEIDGSHEKCTCARDQYGLAWTKAVRCDCGHTSSNRFSTLAGKSDQELLREQGVKVKRMPRILAKTRKRSLKKPAIGQLSFGDS